MSDVMVERFDSIIDLNDFLKNPDVEFVTVSYGFSAEFMVDDSYLLAYRKAGGAE